MKKRIFSMLLTALMIMSLMYAAFSAEVIGGDYPDVGCGSDSMIVGTEKAIEADGGMTVDLPVLFSARLRSDCFTYIMPFSYGEPLLRFYTDCCKISFAAEHDKADISAPVTEADLTRESADAFGVGMMKKSKYISSLPGKHTLTYISGLDPGLGPPGDTS